MKLNLAMPNTGVACNKESDVTCPWHWSLMGGTILIRVAANKFYRLGLD